MKKVLFVATVVKAHIMVFHIPFLNIFKEMGWKTAVAARNDYEKASDCIIPSCDEYYNIQFERSPFKVSNIKALLELKKLIEKEKYDVIHCHTPVGAMITRLAALGVRKYGTKVIYTAHGFHFYKGSPLINWLVYYPVERFLSRFTDVLITINQEDFNYAKKFHAKKVCYVPGVGVDVKKFKINKDNVRSKRKELGFSYDDFLMLSVGELSIRKNHKVVIESLAELKHTDGYSKLHYVICGRGQLLGELRQLANELEVAEHVHFLGFRQDISEICNCSDLFVFMSLQEGLPVALMEAMACGMPVICSGIRGNSDLVENGVNGYISANTSKDVAEAIRMLLNDKEKRIQYAKASLEKIQKFDLDSVVKQMKTIYVDSANG